MLYTSCVTSMFPLLALVSWTSMSIVGIETKPDMWIIPHSTTRTEELLCPECRCTRSTIVHLKKKNKTKAQRFRPFPLGGLSSCSTYYDKQGQRQVIAEDILGRKEWSLLWPTFTTSERQPMDKRRGPRHIIPAVPKRTCFAALLLRKGYFPVDDGPGREGLHQAWLLSTVSRFFY